MNLDEINENNNLIVLKEGGREYIRVNLSDKEALTAKMITKNKIPSLLKAGVREFNSESFLYIDISGRIRFSDMFTGENDILGRDDVEIICSSIKNLMQDIRDYLLDADELLINADTMFYNPEQKSYEFLYIPAAGSEEKKAGFNEGIRLIWERVMEKFNHQSDMESIARVYDIYQKINMTSFNPEEVFAPAAEKENKKDNDLENPFSKENLKETILGESLEHTGKGAGSCGINSASFEKLSEFGESKEAETKSEGIFEGLKMKLAGSAGFFSGLHKDKEARIEEIEKSIEEEENIGFKVKNYLALNSGSVFKVMMCISVLFLALALMPAGVGFKMPAPACVGVFLVSMALGLYARKLGKDREDDLQDGKIN